MKVFLRMLPVIAALAVAGAAACSDPTDAGLATPDHIVATFTRQNMRAGASGSLSAAIVDKQNNFLGTAVTATSANPALVRVDSTTFLPELNQTNFKLVAGASTKVDSTTITLTAGSLTATTKIVVNPAI